ncbi:MAG: hypothetical protein R6U26_03195 [Candidatus Undinarchaeales archaeon]
MKRSYREEGALLINKLFPEYEFDAKVYENADSFNPEDYEMKKGDRLMIRVSGSNNPSVRNPDRIVKSTEETVAFMKRWEDKKVGRFIVQRYPNENRIMYSVSGVLDYNHPTPYICIDIRKITKKFIELNMKTDVRNKTSRDFKKIVSIKYDFFEAPPKVTPRRFKIENFKKPVNKLYKFAKKMDGYFSKKYKTSEISPTFLAVILKNRDIFPVDLKRKYDLSKNQNSVKNCS